MENKNYQKTFKVNVSAETAIEKISQIENWWIKGFTQKAQKLNDQFRIPFGEPSFIDFMVSEWVPKEKVVWSVLDCYLPWFQDKKEWNETQVVFKLSEEYGGTQIEFTHKGLVPDLECYEVCMKGWDGHLNTLESFINEGIRLT